MLYVFSTIFPVFAIIAVGFGLGRYNIFPQNAYKTLHVIVYYIAMPALIITILASAPIIYEWNSQYIAVILGCQLFIMGLSLLIGSNFFHDPLGIRFLHCLSASFSSAAYIGVALVSFVFGNDALLPVIIAVIINGALIMPFGAAMLYFDKKLRYALQCSALQAIGFGVVYMVKNPLFISACVGILLNVFTISLAHAFGNIMTLLSEAAAPLALLATGLFLAHCSVDFSYKNISEIIWVAIVKLIIFPLITLLVITFIIPLNPTYTAVAVLMAALPTSGLVFTLAEQYNIRQKSTSQEILLTTVLSMVSLTICVSYFLTS